MCTLLNCHLSKCEMKLKVTNRLTSTENVWFLHFFTITVRSILMYFRHIFILHFNMTDLSCSVEWSWLCLGQLPRWSPIIVQLSDRKTLTKDLFGFFGDYGHDLESKKSTQVNNCVCVLVYMLTWSTYCVWLLLGFLQTIRAAQVAGRLATHHVTVPRWRSNRRKPRHLIIWKLPICTV